MDLTNAKGQEWQLGVPEARNIRSRINGTSHEMSWTKVVHLMRTNIPRMAMCT